jgi:intracellular sulfur oxidation DsrE/DsrF family protein
MRTLTSLMIVLFTAAGAHAQDSRAAGPVIRSAGEVFEVSDPDFPTPRDQEYKVAFEIAQAADSPEQLNVALNSVARFLNMHAQAGVPQDQIHAAVVVHGSAGWEVLDHAAYRDRYGVDNPNAQLIRELTAVGAQVILCGQTAASRGIPRDGLIEGVDVALSAMTAFLVLQEHGYRVNPW